jgi:8-oxo-dGTP pyrophosphatase MutT (NUDIX family)
VPPLHLEDAGQADPPVAALARGEDRVVLRAPHVRRAAVPHAPKPTSVVPVAVAIVAREDGAVLLIRRTDNGNWALPGGAIEMTESVADAAVRETLEETGIQVEVTACSGSTPTLVMSSTSPATTRSAASSVSC